MADEKRRIIYELLVEAKGAVAAEGGISSIGGALEKLRGIALKALPTLSAGFALKEILTARDDVIKFNQQLSTLGVTGATAAQSLRDVQTIAVLTGQSMQGVTDAYKAAVSLQETLGRNTKYAAETTDAFVRIAAAEGKTAAEAARQIENLGFALQSGVLPAKTFAGWLKESNTFQRAAQEALGKTTAELVKMAQEGKIAEPELTAIALRLEEIGRSTDAPATIDSFTTSIGNMYRAFKLGIAGGGGNTGPQTKLIDPDVVTTTEKITDGVRGIGLEINGLANVAGESTAIIGDGFRLAYNMITGGLDDLKTSREITQAYTRDVNELAAAWEQVKAGAVMGSTSQESYSDEAAKERKAARERANAYAKWKAGEDKMQREMAEMRAYLKKKYEDEKAARDAKREAEQERLEREAIRRTKERQEEIWRLRDESQKNYERKSEEQERAFRKEVEKGLGGPTADDIQATLQEMISTDVPEFTATVLYGWEQIDDATAVLEDSFSQLFTGGIHNAREFFASVAQGLSNMFAQIAAQQAASGLAGLLDDLLSSFKWGSSAGFSSATQAGSGLTNMFDLYAARGLAFNRGRVMPLARGGVVSGPTVFPMAGGMGLMGEAGPEAVMPLKRTADGRLGVAGSTPNVQIVNNLGTAANARTEQHEDRLTIILEAAQMGANLAEERINRSVRTGYGPTAQSVQRTYGLTRRL
jgi:tape measure domain-containing protein